MYDNQNHQHYFPLRRLSLYPPDGGVLERPLYLLAQAVFLETRVSETSAFSPDRKSQDHIYSEHCIARWSMARYLVDTYAKSFIGTVHPRIVISIYTWLPDMREGISTKPDRDICFCTVICVYSAYCADCAYVDESIFLNHDKQKDTKSS